MRIIKPLIIAVSLFASCTLFYSDIKKKVDTPPSQVAGVLMEEQQEYPVKKTYDIKTWKAFSEKGASSVRKYKELHDKSIDEKGYGIFYGSESKYAYYTNWEGVTSYQLILMEQLLADDDSINFCKDTGLNDFNEAFWRVSGRETPSDFKPPMKTDCLEWCVLNMRQSYKESNMIQDWKKIIETAVENSNNTSVSKNYGYNGVMGTELAKSLVKDGWVALYYNPDIITPRDKPAIILPKEEVKKLDLRFLWFDYFMKWTEHTESYRVAKETGYYYGIPVFDFVIDYNPTTELEDMRFIDLKATVPVDKITVKQTDKVEKIKQLPFGLLLARGGQHSAIISYGKVYEVHRALGSVKKNLIEVKDFETKWDWLSGIIVVPPGMW